MDTTTNMSIPTPNASHMHTLRLRNDTIGQLLWRMIGGPITSDDQAEHWEGEEPGKGRVPVLDMTAYQPLLDALHEANMVVDARILELNTSSMAAGIEWMLNTKPASRQGLINWLGRYVKQIYQDFSHLLYDRDSVLQVYQLVQERIAAVVPPAIPTFGTLNVVYVPHTEGAEEMIVGDMITLPDGRRGRVCAYDNAQKSYVVLPQEILPGTEELLPNTVGVHGPSMMPRPTMKNTPYTNRRVSQVKRNPGGGE